MIILSVACSLICGRGSITPWLGMGWISIYATAISYSLKCMHIYVNPNLLSINLEDKDARNIKSKTRAMNACMSISTYEEIEDATMNAFENSAKYTKTYNNKEALHRIFGRHSCAIKSCKWAFKSHAAIQTKKLCVKFYVVTTRERSYLHKRLNKSPPAGNIY